MKFYLKTLLKDLVLVILLEIFYVIYQFAVISYKSASNGLTQIENFTLYFKFTTFLIIYFIILIVSYVFYCFYFHTIRYEILNTEIHVYKGLITSTRKVVPMRTITNISVTRGLMDQLLGIGSIEIQTAGTVMVTSQKGAVELLEGLPANILVDIQEKVISLMRNLTKSKTIKEQTLNPLNSEESRKLILEKIEEIKKMLGTIISSK